MKMCATRPLLPGQRKLKVISPNKTGMSARSSSPKMKIEEEQENTAELGNDAQLDSRTKLDERT